MSTHHDRRTFLRLVFGAAGAGAGVALLAACSTPPAAAPAATQAQVAPAQNTSVTKVSYAYASPNGLHFVATVGSEKPDLAHKFGVEFDLLTTTNSPNAVNALVGGSVNVAAATPDSAWPAQDKATDVKQLWPVANGTPYVMLTQPEYKKVSDLKGKTVGVSALVGGADTTAFKIMANENGLATTDYTLVQAGAISDRTAAMQAKSIDGCANLEPQASLLRDAGFPEIDTADNYAPLKGVHSIVLMSKQSWYQGNSDVPANFVRAWDAITKWIYDPANKDEVIAIAKKTMGGTDAGSQAVYKLHVDSQSVPQNLRMQEKMLQQFTDNLRKAGSDNVPQDAMKYVDTSLVTKVLGA
ncbi:MAG: ABC transporter substrate-binding protein [Chloroflexi bacterium]|nr:ABC transporter substrate-binding protein [Chloroflexota bacterium]MBV9898268.1 ABC transporter substrate-binding protein [Chloroflexota bacterium]